MDSTELNIILNLGILFIFKYYNFINESVFYLFNNIGLRMQMPELSLLLPVGISFYTFQAIGYSIDVYKGELKAERNFGIYALFVSFFPQLVAGPIERAKNLLPQFRIERNFNEENLQAGLKQMLWGFFMKVVIADRASIYVDSIYNNVANHNGSSFLIATFLFSIQIYCDFAGYSNIAIGAAKIMGFDLMENFRRPYFSSSISELWRRWHISLSTWFKDYVYIPLGGNRVKKYRHLLNLLITFTVSGLWHGANWTFVCWGGLHGFFLIIESLYKKGSNKSLKILTIVTTYLLTSFAWIFFRANSIADALHIISQIFTNRGAPFLNKTVLIYSVIGIIILILKEIMDEFFPGKVNLFNSRFLTLRYLSYAAVVTLIMLLGVFDGGQFIYFQF